MNARRMGRAGGWLLAGLCGLAAAAEVVAPEATQYRIDAATVDGGGGRSMAPGFALSGTIGQPDADPLQPSVADGFGLIGGFWPQRAGLLGDRIFVDGFES